ncbi:hypothetical protein [Ferruginibacter profundus]
MAQDRTSGYDMLVQISEAEINNQLATAFLAGSIIPASMSVPVNSGGLVGNAALNFRTPVADLDRPRPKMGITIPFVNSQLALTAPAPVTIAPVSGTITIVDDIQVLDEVTTQTVVMDFNSGAPNVSVAFDAASQALLAPFLAIAGMTLLQAQNLVAGMVLQELQNNLHQIELSPPIPVSDDTNPTTVFDIDVTTINDTSAADRDCIVLGIKMASDSGGNINTATTNFIPAGSQSLVMMSNFWLLARVMRPRVASALGLAVSDLDTPLRLNRNVPAPGGRGTLTRLEARIDGNRIRVDGRATDSGTGWSAESNFFFFIDISLSGGALNITATTPDVDTDVDLEWWVWLTTLGLGGLFFGIAGVIVSAIVLAIVEAVAEGIVDNLISDGISGSLGAIPSIPLGPIGSGLTMTSVLLDDLELRCAILRSITVPVKSQGQYSSLQGFALDLETGNIRATAVRATDLIWNPSSGISIGNTAGLTVTNVHYNTLTPVQISNMALNRTNIPSGMIPLTFPATLPFFPHDEIVFGVRTAEGRLAKVKAWRSLMEGGAIKLEWVTYDTPIPSLEITSKWLAAERGEVKEYITDDCRFCRSSQVRWRGIFEAKSKLMAFPIDYEWCFCGQVLKDAEGEISYLGNKLSYKVNRNKLVIETTTLGQNINCELCVSAIDNRGQELFVCTKVVKSGLDVKCRKCGEKKPLVDLIYQPIDYKLVNWRPLLSEAVMLSRKDILQVK